MILLRSYTKTTKTGTIAASGFSSIFIQRVYDLQLTSAVLVFCTTLPQYLINELVHIEKRGAIDNYARLELRRYLLIFGHNTCSRPESPSVPHIFQHYNFRQNHTQSSTFCHLATILGIVWETIAPRTFHVFCTNRAKTFLCLQWQDRCHLFIKNLDRFLNTL